MGQIYYGLHDFFKRSFADFIQEKGQRNGRQHTDREIQKTEGYGISESRPEEGIFEKESEILQSDKVLYPENAVLIEGNSDSVHGNIVKDKEERQDRRQHEIKGFIFMNSFF